MPPRPARLARRFFTSFAVTFGVCALAYGCGGGGGGSPAPPFVEPSPGPSPSTSPSASPSSSPSASPSASPAPSPPATPVPTPSPSPTPAPAPLALSRTSAAFTLAGTSATVTASEAAYGGPIVTDASACANVATVAPSAANAPATFTITAQGGGACTLVFTDAYGQRATLPVGVTVTQGTVR